MYKIKLSYSTGDSFHSEDVEEYVDLEWENLEVAKKALNRIKEHYEWYSSITNNYSFSPKPLDKPKWWNCPKCQEEKYEDHYALNLPLDDGTEFELIYPFWIGYFESLYGGEIVTNDPSVSFTI